MFYQIHSTLFPLVIFFWTTSCLLSEGAASQLADEVHGNGNKLESSFFFYQHSTYPRDCREVQEKCSNNNATGVFLIKPDGYLDPFEVYCDSTDSYDGWTIIQRRIDGSINFNRYWENYKSGFGFLSQEFWLGNEKLSFLTNQKKYQLMIEMTTSDGSQLWVAYDDFRVSDGFSNYKITSLGEYSGSTGNLVFCPNNMASGNCRDACQRTCGAPRDCQAGLCAAFEACVCPDGFFINGSNCVPPEQCGCYESEGHTIIPEGNLYVTDGCSRKGVCKGGEMIWNERYECSPNAVCDVRNNIRKCYCNEGFQGDGETCSGPKDCQEIYEAGSRDNGIYRISPTSWTGSAFEVYCNMSDGGGWTVFQRRVDGSEDFYLGWSSYKEGFGNLNHEFWLGNDKLYYLTNQKRYGIRIDLVNRYGDPYYAKFDYFRINDESDNYRLSGVGTYSGTADSRSNADGYALTYHRGQQFTTKDRDNDAYSYYNFAVYYGGPWWFSYSSHSTLNCRYGTYYFYWYYLPGSFYNLKFTEMKVRPV